MATQFPFLFKKFVPELGLLYQGDKTTLRYTVNEQDSMSWFESLDDSYIFQQVTIKFLGRDFSFKLPLGHGEVVNVDLQNFFIKEASLRTFDDIIMGIRVEIMKRYDVVKDKERYAFRAKTDVVLNPTPDAGLLLMKEFIDGYYRFEPIKRIIKQKDGKEREVEYPIGFDYTGKDAITYSYHNVKYKTPVFGVYAPIVRDMMFGDMIDFGGGRVLQNRQLEVLLKMGQINYIAAPRGAGKSWLLSFIGGYASMRQPLSVKEKLRPIQINYFGLDDASNDTVVQYIMRMRDRFKAVDMFKWNQKSRTLSFMSAGSELGRITFLSSESRAKGRGRRPNMIIIDEAAHTDRKVFDVNLPIVTNDGAVMVCISTINKETKKGWFYEGLIAAEFRQLNYAPIDDLIVSLWKKYGLDQVKSRKGLDKIDLVALRDEMKKLRKVVALRYTIDDVEHMTEDEKDSAVAEASLIGLDFLYAEYYSRFLDEKTIFKTEGLVKSKSEIDPIKFDSVVMAYDPAHDYDNGAVVLIGTVSARAYIFKSVILPKDGVERHMELIKDIRIQALGRLRVDASQHIPLIVDVTQSSAFIKEDFRLHGVYIDLAVHYTSGNDMKSDGLDFNVPKATLVSIAKKFFTNGYVVVQDDLHSLMDEMTFFQVKDNSDNNRVKYEAVKGKDDQVNAMMMALLFLHERQGLKYQYAELESNPQESYFEKIDRLEAARKKQSKIESGEVYGHRQMVEFGY